MKDKLERIANKIAASQSDAISAIEKILKRHNLKAEVQSLKSGNIRIIPKKSSDTESISDILDAFGLIDYQNVDYDGGEIIILKRLIKKFEGR